MARRAHEQHGYYVDVHDWPTGTTDNDLSPEEIFDTLEELDEYYEGAVESLNNPQTLSFGRK